MNSSAPDTPPTSRLDDPSSAATAGAPDATRSVAEHGFLAVLEATPQTALDAADAIPPAATQLTDEQRAIVVDCAHHQLVEAGAGSGKTTLLVEKLLYELGYQTIDGAGPAQSLSLSQIGAITFTKKAAAEITDRVRAALIARARAATGVERERLAEQAFALEQVNIGTIDSFAAKIVRDYGGHDDVETGFTVLDPADGDALRDEVAGDALLAGIRANDAGAVCLAHHFGFTRARDIVATSFDNAGLLLACREAQRAGRLGWEHLTGVTLNAVDELLRPHAAAIFAFLCAAYDQLTARMRADGVADYTTVLLMAVDLAQNPAVQREFQERVRLLIVDEHQDTNLHQVTLVGRLTGVSATARAASAAQGRGAGPAASSASTAERPPAGCRLILVGDPKQSIYGFRQADVTMWERSWRLLKLAGGKRRRLSTNHRSLPVITDFVDVVCGAVLGRPPAAPRRGARAQPALPNPFEVPFLPLRSGRPEGPGGVELLLAPETGPTAGAAIVAARIAAILEHPDDYPIADPAGGPGATRAPTASDIAILARNLRSAAGHYERELRDRGIGSYVYGGRGLYARPEVQDLANVLRAVAEPQHNHALAAYLRSPFGRVDDLTLAELAAAREVGPGPRRPSGETLYDVLPRAARVVRDRVRLRRVQVAVARLEMLRELRDRVPHDELIATAMEDARYRAVLAGAPDAPAGVRNVEKLLRIVRRAGNVPLAHFVQRFVGAVRRAEQEDEAPLYTLGDPLVAITTIHKAKGLQWPIVVLAGTDEVFFRRIDDETPALARPPIGVALPLDVVFRDDGADVPVVERSRVWEHHTTTARLREYAEAKRIFYVACTRAQDRLLLAGARVSGDDHANGERDLHPKGPRDLEFLHLKAPERWLRCLFPDARGTTPGIRLSTFRARQADGSEGPARTLVVRSGLDAMVVRPTDLPTVTAADTAGVTPAGAIAGAFARPAAPSRGLLLQDGGAEPAAPAVGAPATGSGSAARGGAARARGLREWPTVPMGGLPAFDAAVRDGVAPDAALAASPERYLPEPASVGTWARSPGGAATDDAPTPRAPRWPAPLPDQIARVDGRGLFRTEFTASELLQFARCDWRHHFGYVASVSQARVEAAHRDALVEAIPQAEFGDILHGYFRAYRPGWSEAERRHAMTQALLRKRPMNEEQLASNLPPLFEHADRYLSSPWFTRVTAGAPAHRELPFVVQLAPTVRLRGALDLVFTEADGARVLDFKTAIFQNVDAARLDRLLDAKAREYDVQAMVYALAAQHSAGTVPVREFVFFFTSVGEWRTLPISPAWLAEARGRLVDLVEALRRATKVRDSLPRPRWERSKCLNCEYSSLCRPLQSPLT